MSVSFPFTDFSAHSDTGYDDTPVAVTVLRVPIPKIMWLELHLLTVTLFSPPEGVNVGGEVCTCKIKTSEISEHVAKTLSLLAMCPQLPLVLMGISSGRLESTLSTMATLGGTLI